MFLPQSSKVFVWVGLIVLFRIDSNDPILTYWIEVYNLNSSIADHDPFKVSFINPRRVATIYFDSIVSLIVCSLLLHLSVVEEYWVE